MKRLLVLFFGVLFLLPVTVTAQGQPGIWLSPAEIAALPAEGAAWTALLAAANASAGTPNLKDQDSNNDVMVLAKALVYAKTGDVRYREQVLQNLRLVPNTEDGGRTLALGRNLPGYVIAADLIDLKTADPQFDQVFRAWLAQVRTERLDGRTLISTHEDRPNNWGTHAGAARAAIAVYLGDREDLARTAQVFRGWLGERDQYAGFSYGALDWQCDPAQPVGINPAGCVRNGIEIGGAQPEEMRRGDTLKDPPVYTGYAHEALQGALVQAVILQRAGYPAFEWGDRALLRAWEYLEGIGWPAEGDDRWLPWLVNHYYGRVYKTTSPAGHGKNLGFTDWTHVQIVLPDPTDAPTATLPPEPTATETPEPTATPAPSETPTAPPAARPTLCILLVWGDAGAIGMRACPE